MPKVTQNGVSGVGSPCIYACLQNYVLSTLPHMSELSETFLGLVLRNLNKFLSGILCKSKILLLKLNRLARGKGGEVKIPAFLDYQWFFYISVCAGKRHLSEFSPCPLCFSNYCLTRVDGEHLNSRSKILKTAKF